MKYYTWDDVETAANAIMASMAEDRWRPDYIVGVTRGGLALALILSHRLGVRMETLKVKLKNNEADEGCESNCWMADDAFGYLSSEDQSIYKSRWDINKRKKILIVDNINNTGATVNWIKQDWQSSCLPNEDSWNTVWGHNVRFAVMTENLSSEFTAEYHWHEIRSDDNRYIYPWEKEAWLKLNSE